MTMTDVYNVLNEAFPGAVESGPLGVTMGPLRIERGSGIAGRGDTWAITFPGTPEVSPICGLRTRAELRAALRELILRIVQLGEAIRRNLV